MAFPIHDTEKCNFLHIAISSAMHTNKNITCSMKIIFIDFNKDGSFFHSVKKSFFSLLPLQFFIGILVHFNRDKFDFIGVKSNSIWRKKVILFCEKINFIRRKKVILFGEKK